MIETEVFDSWIKVITNFLQEKVNAKEEAFLKNLLNDIGLPSLSVD